MFLKFFYIQSDNRIRRAFGSDFCQNFPICDEFNNYSADFGNLEIFFWYSVKFDQKDYSLNFILYFKRTDPGKVSNRTLPAFKTDFSELLNDLR